MIRFHLICKLYKTKIDTRFARLCTIFPKQLAFNFICMTFPTAKQSSRENYDYWSLSSMVLMPLVHCNTTIYMFCWSFYLCVIFHFKFLLSQSHCHMTKDCMKICLWFAHFVQFQFDPAPVSTLLFSDKSQNEQPRWWTES